MDRLNVTPQETLILEDNDHGIQAAIASGAHLLMIKSIEDVNYQNISRRILEINVRG